MQLDEMVVVRPDQARALQESGFLGRFLEPASPSDVARALGLRANLVHHHARRLEGLGLLRVVKRDEGRVYYQLVARVFKHRRSVLPVGDPDEQANVVLGLLKDQFLSAYGACDRQLSGEDADWHVYAFERPGTGKPAAERAPIDDGPARPAHLQLRTLSLTPERYRRLVEEIAGLIAAAEAESGNGSASCTLAFLAMDGALQVGTTDQQFLSSFLPLHGLAYADPDSAGSESQAEGFG